MGHGHADLTWQILEEDEWEAQQQAHWTGRAIPARRPRQRIRLWRGVAALVTVLLISGYGIWRTAQAGLDQVRAEIQRTMDLEKQAWQQGDKALAKTLTDSAQTWDDGRQLQWLAEVETGIQAKPQVTDVRVQRMELHDRLALVEVIEIRQEADGQVVPYREARVYRQIGEDWLRSAPQPNLWGAQHTAETEHFHFVYRQRDSEAVTAVMAEIEDLYNNLRQEVGLGPTGPDRTITVEVMVPTVHEPYMPELYQTWTGYPIPVLSPSLVAAPVDLPAAAVLRQSIATVLANQTWEEALVEYAGRGRWLLMIEGIRLWMRRDSGSDAMDPHSALAGSWQERILQDTKVRLPELATTQYTCDEYYCNGDRLDLSYYSLAAQTVVEYAMATYGRECLPALLVGFSRYDTWEEVIPAVFGVSVAEFESGWLAYLDARLAGSTPSSSLPTQPGR